MEEMLDVLNELGEFTGRIATRNECHAKGLWHRAVYGFIFNNEGEILLQKRSNEKKLWPGKWDVTVGGHLKSGEFGMQALKRECMEELGLKVSNNEIEYIVSSTSRYNKNNYINNHYDECYIIHKNININAFHLQSNEVSQIRFFNKEEIINRINNNFDGLTEKTGSWHFFKKIIERYDKI